MSSLCTLLIHNSLEVLIHSDEVAQHELESFHFPETSHAGGVVSVIDSETSLVVTIMPIVMALAM